jgi:hypothetical protein
MATTGAGPGRRDTTVAPPRLAPNISLLTCADIVPNGTLPDGSPDLRWMNGLRYRRAPFGTGSAKAMGYIASSGLEVPMSKTGTAADRNEVDVDPFLVYVEEQMSTLGFPTNDYVARATQLLAVTEAYQVEKEFWTGTLAKASAVAGADYAADQWLAQQVTCTTLTAAPIGRALGVLEQAMADVNGGEPGMIHMRREALHALMTVMLATPIGPPGARQCTKPYDISGNVLVPGWGYSGIGPDGTTPAAGHYWLYGTGPVRIRRDDVQVVPGTYKEAMNRLTNDIDFRAERAYSVDWDRSCHFAILADATGIAGY